MWFKNASPHNSHLTSSDLFDSLIIKYIYASYLSQLPTPRPTIDCLRSAFEYNSKSFTSFSLIKKRTGSTHDRYLMFAISFKLSCFNVNSVSLHVLFCFIDLCFLCCCIDILASQCSIDRTNLKRQTLEVLNNICKITKKIHTTQ